MSITLIYYAMSLTVMYLPAISQHLNDLLDKQHVDMTFHQMTSYSG